MSMQQAKANRSR